MDSSAPLRPPVALLVGDHQEPCDALAARIIRSGWSAIVHGKGFTEATLLAKRHVPDLVLLHTEGPRVTAQQHAVAVAIKRLLGLPVLAITGPGECEALTDLARLSEPFDDRELATTMDVAVLRSRAERARHVLDDILHSAPHGVVVLDARYPGQPAMLCSPAFEQITGYSFREVKDQFPALLFGAETGAAERKVVRQALNEPRERTMKLPLERKDGTPFWADLTIWPGRNRLGGVTHVVCHLSEATLRHNQEDGVLQAQRVEALGQLTGSVAHDFNNLISIVLSYAAFVRESLPEADPRQGDLAEITNAGERAAQLTAQLFSFSRRRAAQARTVELNHAIRALRPLLERTLGPTRALDIIESDRAALVRIDPSHVDQLLLNLTVNARDAMPSGGALTIALAVENRTVTLTVRDTGVGMDAETARQAFEPFFTTKPHGTGAGLGLATSATVVRQASGTMEVQSGELRGTCFVVKLPLEDPETPVTTPRRSTIPRLTKSMRVLVVDDEDAVRRATCRMLTGAGCEVTDAGSVAAALDALRGPVAPKVVVCDIVLPDGSGFDVVDYAKEHCPTTRILLTTGYSQQIEAHDLDPDDVLWKPYTKGQLLQAVVGLLMKSDEPTT